jgi:hypothetical protein
MGFFGFRRFVNGLAVVVAVFAAAGCSSATVTPEDVRPPTATVRTIAVGEIEAGPERWKRLVRFFRNGLVRRLLESEAFDTVLYSAPKSPLPGSITVSGRITDVDEGSEAARLLVGMGFGSAEVAGRFEIAAAGSERLAVFEQRQVSTGGTGRDAHWNPVYVEDLIEQLGEETASTIIRWRDGQDLQPPAWQGLW